MNKHLKFFAGAGALAVVVGLTMGAVRASQNDIVFGGNGPIKLISPNGVVILSSASQPITPETYIYTGHNDSVEPEPKRYAFFILDLNDGFSISEGGSTWLGVELKASTNNFGMVLSENPAEEMRKPCFWSCTELQVGSTWVDPDIENMDGCLAFTTWVKATPGDNRAWYRIKSTILDYIDTSDNTNLKFPRKIGILVDPSLLKTTIGNTDWLRSDNDEIVWSYMRTNVSGYETNGFGKAIWTICEPACWFKSLPRWANSGVNAVSQ